MQFARIVQWRSRLVIVELRGRKYAIPRKPRLLRFRLSGWLADRLGARGIGRAEADGFSLKDEQAEQYHYENYIDEQANRAIAETRDVHQVRRANVVRAGEDARQQGIDAQPRLVKEIEQDRADEET